MTSTMDHVRELLAFVYDAQTADDVTARLEERHPAATSEGRSRFGNGDAVLISYADTVRDTSAAPRRTDT